MLETIMFKVESVLKYGPSIENSRVGGSSAGGRSVGIGGNA